MSVLINESRMTFIHEFDLTISLFALHIHNVDHHHHVHILLEEIRNTTHLETN